MHVETVNIEKLPMCQYKRLSDSSSRRSPICSRKSIEIVVGNRNSIINETESSLPTALKNKIRYTHKNPMKKGRSMLYLLDDHVIDMFDQSLKQCNATELRYKRLDQTTKTALFMQARGHQDTIDKLNETIKYLEEMNMQHMRLYDDLKDFHEHRFRYAYKNTETDTPSTKLDKCEREIGILHMQLAACEQSTHKTVSHYATELEKERLESRKLTTIIQNQQETISSLENKLTETQFVVRTSSTTQKPEGHGSHDLIKALVDLQSRELDDKKKLLVNLLDEREELLQKIDGLSSPTSTVIHKQKLSNHQDRSSIDLLAQLAKSDLVYKEKSNRSTVSSSSSVLFYSSPPPLSPPPTFPLPPTPKRRESSNLTRPLLPPEEQPKDVKAANHGTEPWGDFEFEDIESSLLENTPSLSPRTTYLMKRKKNTD